MTTASSTAWDRYRPWRHHVEIGAWIAFYLVNASLNTATELIEVRRAGLDYAAWEPATWEWSSNLMLLALVPALVWFSRRFPPELRRWQRSLAIHLAGSVVYSLVHVSGMVLLRELVYAAQGSNYQFGELWRELVYEYLKDVRSYLFSLVLIEGYRLLLRRMQGEARLLDAPDDAPALEPVERPQRFLVRKLGREFLVAAADVEFAQAAGNYVNLRVRGRDFPLRSTLAELETRLDPGRFIRVHRGHMINLDQLASIEPLDTGDARLHLLDGSVLPCSRRYRSALRERFEAKAATA